MASLDYVFPERISRGAIGGNEWLTQKIKLLNGNEVRNSRRTKPYGRWDVSHALKDKTNYQVLRNLFLAVKGSGQSILFTDHKDYQSDTAAPGQSCSPATGDGSNLIFQLQKSYTVDAPLTAYVRTITKPKSGTLSVYVNGVLKTEGANPGGDYQVNYSTGVVTFNAGKAPPNTHTVRAVFEFYKVVRFEQDDEQASMEHPDLFDWNNIVLVEVYE